MKDFGGKIAVVTGGGSGMGRALTRQLIAAGCNVATCDVIEENLAETRRLAAGEATGAASIFTAPCDVADESQVTRFRDQVAGFFGTDHINLLINNAGVAGGGSFITASREEWERTFHICWHGVYLFCRAFIPLLLKSTEGHLVNISSVNGFRAANGPMPHTAYSAAKFAVRGLSEALINDFRLNAPHVNVSVVMPGHVGTDLSVNTRRIQGSKGPDELTAEDLAQIRRSWGRLEEAVAELSDQDIRERVRSSDENFRNGGLAPEQAATIILDGVCRNNWRILVGNDAVAWDKVVRRDPIDAYDDRFFERVREALTEEPNPVSTGHP